MMKFIALPCVACEQEQRLAALIVHLVCLLLDANDLLGESVELVRILADRAAAAASLPVLNLPPAG